MENDIDYLEQVEEAKRALKEAEENLRIAEEELYLAHLSSAETRLHKLGYDFQQEGKAYLRNAFMLTHRDSNLEDVEFIEIEKENANGLNVEIDDADGNSVDIPYELFECIYDLLKERGRLNDKKRRTN